MKSKPSEQAPLPSTPPKEPPKPTPTPEELAKKAAETYETMWGEKPPPDVAGTKTAGTVAPPAEPTGTAAAPVISPTPAPAPTPPPPQPPKPTPAEPMDTSAIIQETAERVGRSVTEAMTAQKAPEPAPAPAKPDFELSPEDQEAYELTQFMASQDSKHAETPGQLLEYFRQLYAYQDKWMADNPEKAWDANDAEHKDWFDAHPQPIDAETLEDAKLDMRVEKKVQERIKPVLDMTQKMDQEKAFQEAIPKITENLNKWQLTMVDAVNPALGAMVRDAQGKPALTKENIDRLAEADPIAKAVLDDLHDRRLMPVLIELEKTAAPGMNYRLQPRSNPVHAFIDDHRRRLEADLQSLPAADRVRNGKSFLTITEMNQRQQAIANGPGTRAVKEQKIAELERTHYCVSVDDLEDVITHEIAAEAKRTIEQIDGLGKKKYVKNGAPAAQTPQPAPAPAPAPSPARTAAPRPPSISSQSEMVASPESGGHGTKSKGETAVEVHFK